MPEKDKTSFPMLPVKHWWALRERFKASIPGVVSPTYIATTLNMQEQSARSNVLLPLRTLGIIDEENRTVQDLAIAWRDDERYAEICTEMLHRVYPAELIEAVPNPVADRDAAERWFAAVTGSGNAGVRRMVALYAVLAQPDLTSMREKKVPAPRSRKKKEPTASMPRRETSMKRSTKAHVEDTQDSMPEIAINLQIHISSDATPDQIDAIFASMSKHIYRK